MEKAVKPARIAVMNYNALSVLGSPEDTPESLTCIVKEEGFKAKNQSISLFFYRNDEHHFKLSLRSYIYVWVDTIRCVARTPKIASWSTEEQIPMPLCHR